MKCLEWSTGSSTLWVLMRVRHLISIEHHAHWSRMVAQQLAKIYNPDVGFFPFHQRTPCTMYDDQGRPHTMETSNMPLQRRGPDELTPSLQLDAL